MNEVEVKNGETKRHITTFYKITLSRIKELNETGYRSRVVLNG